MALNTFENTAATFTASTGYTLGLAPGTSRWLTELDGWIKGAPMRRNETRRLWGHGNFEEDGKRDQRLITVGGHLTAPTRAEAAAFTDEINAVLGDGTAGVLAVDDADLGVRQARVYLAGDPEIDWTGGRDVSFVLTMTAPDPRKYGIPVTSSTSPPIPGGGLKDPLFMSSGVLGTLYNEIPNPVPNSTTGYSSTYSGGSGSWTHETSETEPFNRHTKDATLGTFAAYAQGGPGTTVTAGVPVSMGWWIRSSVAITGQFRNALTAIPGATFSLNANEWTFVKFENYAPLVGTFRLAAIFTSYPANGLLDIKKAQWNVGTTLNPYFSGDTPSTTTDHYSWAGTAHNSRSVYQQIGPSVLDFGIPGSLGTVTFTNEGRADTAPLFRVEGPAPGFTITRQQTGARLVYPTTIPPGSVLYLNAADGSVKLDGYADRSTDLSVGEWERINGGESATWLFEAADDSARLFVEAAPAWW